MWILSLLPFALQTLAIGFDEIWFHRRRGLPKWERIGHPIDTLTVLICMGFVLFVPYSKAALLPYSLLAIFSSLMVTKDEFVHKQHCPASENWLHAILFLLHPVTFASAALIWPISQGLEGLAWTRLWPSAELKLFLNIQFLAMSCFMTYQIIYWNFIWRPRDQQ